MALSVAELASRDGEPVALYAEDPRSLSDAVIDDPRLLVLLSPTPSPFSHDANLIRALSGRLGIVGVCGFDPGALGVQGGDLIEISPMEGVAIAAGRRLPLNSGVAGSDEPLGILLSRTFVCYRPTYFYHPWMGHLIARGLEEGLGTVVAPSSSGAKLDGIGRVWLDRGPLPEALAGWILDHRPEQSEMLAELAAALVRLSAGPWSNDLMLEDSEFLELLAISCRTAPFVGFPLFSLSRRCAIVSGGLEELSSRVLEISPVIGERDRRTGRLSPESAAAVAESVERVRTHAQSASDVDIVALTVVISDLRRLVIDQMRRDYPAFDVRVNHRELT